jgi:glutathione synthase/RimK-type ligase-like ATP-grasp enzyme
MLSSRVVNPLAAEARASKKLVQLQHAVAAGLEIPRTLVTNNIEDAQRFVSESAHCVFKVLTGTRWQLSDTRRWRGEYAPYLEHLRLAPTIFQEEIRDKIDLRATIVDGQVFTVAIRPQHPAADLDWRLDPGATYEPYDLPQEVVKKLAVLQCSLGLRYGAIDLAVTGEGRVVFFEVNPSGQFLFAEIHAGVRITAALANALVFGTIASADVPGAVSAQDDKGAQGRLRERVL